MCDCADYDEYTEPQPAEVSGPVGTTRTRARRVAYPCPSFEFASALVRCCAVAQPEHTGPPAR
jgi:hypothetical protein